ncbi:MAG TPA: cobalamin-binding protein, partial [Casimicrobiaceae bacterium]|nr:cobalamin-binding protein [Casimicrobiaceae bacterium]
MLRLAPARWVTHVVLVASTAFWAPARGEGAIHALDDLGNDIALAAPAKRIIALAPHAAELVYAAGAGSHLVAVIKGTDYPPVAASLPTVGDVNGLDLERIIA